MAKKIARPTRWDFWSPSERYEWIMEHRVRAEGDTFAAEIDQRCPELHMTASNYGDKRQDAVIMQMARMRAHLKRLLPQFDEIIDLCFHDTYDTPCEGHLEPHEVKAVLKDE